MNYYRKEVIARTTIFALMLLAIIVIVLLQ